MVQLTSKKVFLFSFIIIFTAAFLWFSETRNHQIKTSILRSETLAEQLSTALSIIAADRTRAFDAMAGNWPVTNANQVDWFNVQGRSLMKMLPGIQDIWLYDQNQRLIWTIFNHSSQRGSVKSEPASLVQLSNGQLIEIDHKLLVVYHQTIHNGASPLWHLVMMMDPKTIIGALTADWQERAVAFKVMAENKQLFDSGVFTHNFPIVDIHVGFAGMNWKLSVQSQEQQISSHFVHFVLSIVISLMMSLVLAWWVHQRNLVSALNVVYRTAADASPDAMLIFKAVDKMKSPDQFYLFSCNSAALQMTDKPDQSSLTPQVIGRLLGIDAFEALMLQVLEQGNGYFQLIKLKQRTEQEFWVKLQIVKMIEGVVVTLQNVSKEQALQKKITHQANHDQLTGLLNRYAFSQLLQSSIQQPDPCHLCYIDMDHFKVINDTCGHLAGDELLKRTAGILGAVLHKQDVLARVGGDEFCMLIKNVELDEVKLRLKSLFDKIAQFRFFWDDQVFTIGASIGVVSLNGSLVDVRSALKAADAGCYLAKASGRNRYFIVDEQQSAVDHLEEERNCLQLVRSALINHHFELYAQPIVPLQSKELLQMEVLLRLFQPDGSAISPGIFIPLAERQGLMKDIDLWVIDKVLKKLVQFKSKLHLIAKVAINISGTSLGDPEFLKSVTRLLLDSEVPTSIICFEITETAAVSNLAQAQIFIAELRQYGCRFSLDDFGAGMSSFGYLRDMHVDYVKIDGSFVKNMTNNHIDAVMVKAISDIAHSLGKKTIAEFVTDDATANMLAEMGVEYGQGFGLGKPKSFDEVLTTICLP